MILKAENIFEHKYVQQYKQSKQYNQKQYNQQYGQSDQSDIINNKARAI